jgi:hypothetical protein
MAFVHRESDSTPTVDVQDISLPGSSLLTPGGGPAPATVTSPGPAASAPTSREGRTTVCTQPSQHRQVSAEDETGQLSCP